MIVKFATKRLLKSSSNDITYSHTIRSGYSENWNWVYKITMAMSGIMILVGAIWSIHIIIFLQCALSAIGTIVEIEEEKDIDSAVICYAPVLMFKDTKSVTHKVRSSTKTTFTPEFEIGDKIEILYSSINPDSNYIMENNFWGIWGTVVNYVIGALFFFNIAIIINYIAKRRRPVKN